MQQKISHFKSRNDTTTPTHIQISEYFDIIKTKHKDLVTKCLYAETYDEIDSIKNNLPAATISGTFSKRNSEGLLNYSGLICLDFDFKKKKPTIQECRKLALNYKEQLKNDKYIFAAWISPSGTGVKAIVKVINSPQLHKKYFKALLENYEYLDKSGSDISRLCYDSYDPLIYINNAAVVWDILPDENIHFNSTEKVYNEITDEKELFDVAIKIINKTRSFSDGYRNQYIFSLSCLINKFGVSKISAENLLSEFIRSDFSINEIRTAINSAYKYTNEHGTYKYESPKVKEYVFSSIKEGKKKEDIKKHLVEAEKYSIESAEKLVERLYDRAFNQKNTFWKVTFDKQGEVKKFDFIYDKFVTFLTINGFWKYRINLSCYKLIKISENIVCEVTPDDIKNFTLRWCRNIPEESFDGINKDILLQYIYKGVSNYFSENIFITIPEININIHTSDSLNTYLYYLNYVVKISKEEIILHNYCDIKGYIWENRIIKRQINLSEDFDCDYSTFLQKISHDKTHLQQIISCIGYLLTPFKTRANAKSVIFTDEIIDENANGGTGKGILMQGVSKIRETATINGKGFSFDKTFAFQLIDLDTEIIFFDDAAKGFDFERLFSIITEGISIEKKNQNEFTIPFETSPKIAISTNYVIKGEGSSFERRRINVELKNYFNVQKTPLTEFGRMLFDDWEPTDWNKFDNFMMSCVQFYLKNGIIDFVSDTEPYKRLVRLTSLDFIDFANGIELNTDLSKEDYFEKYRKNYSIKWNKINKFSASLRYYCDYKGYELKVRYSDFNGKQTNYFKFSTKDEVNEELTF